MKKILLTILFLFTILFLRDKLAAQCPAAGDLTFNTQASIDWFIILYPNCTQIDGNVTIEGTDIWNFWGLSNIQEITGNLTIQNNPALPFPSWLSNLTTIGGDLIVYNNAILESLRALNGLQSVNNIFISSNPQLIDFAGTYSGQEGLISLTTIGGYLDIYNNAALTSLSGLDNLTSIGGYLSISLNLSLNSLSKLDNLTTLGGSLSIDSNNDLTSLAGLDNISSTGGYFFIGYNSSLTSLSELSNLSSIGGDFSISGNTGLTSLSGLDNLSSIDGFFRIDYTALTSLSALNNLTSINGHMIISDNTQLTSLSGLDNIDPTTIYTNDPNDYAAITIYNNSNLSECEVLSICEVLSNGGTTNIHDNKSGCNSESEVTTACTLPDCTTLTDPTDGQTGVLITTNLSWAASTNADGYILKVGTSPGIADIHNGDVGNVTTWNPPNNFDCGIDIYVTINPYNNAPYDNNCSEESFTTEYVTANAGNDAEICSGSSTQLQASGGTVYSWSPTDGLSNPNIANPVANPASTTIYTVTVSNANGCQDTDEVTVTVNPNPIPNASATDETGNDFNDGTATCAPSSGTPGYTYHWSNGQNTQTIMDLVPGDYIITVTDSKSCTGEETVTVDEFICPELTINASMENISCNGDCDGSIEVESITNGVALFTYEWSDGQTTQTATGLCPDEYTVTVTDAKNCSVFSDIFLITEPEELTVVGEATEETYNDAEDGTAGVFPSGGTPPYTYNWNTGEDTQTITDLAPGIYYATVTDDNDCTVETNVEVEEFICPDLTIEYIQTDVQCYNDCDGLIEVSEVTNGEEPLTYNWSDGQTTQYIADLCPGDYSVTVTDFYNCSVSQSFVINEPEELLANASATDETANNANDGTATAAPSGGTSPYSYNWSTGATTQSIDNLAPGTYTVTVSDYNNCTVEQSVTVNSFGCPTLTINTSSSDAGCFGECNGSISINSVDNAQSPLQYQWSNDATTSSISDLCAGNYTVTITDNVNCSVIQTYTISQNPQLTATIDATDETANNTSDGTAVANPSGGTSPYSYIWSTGATTQSISNLAPGNYTVTVTDDASCTTVQSCSINKYGCTEFIIKSNISNVACFGQCDGSIHITDVQNAVQPLSYQWSDGHTGAIDSVLCAGGYFLTITDKNNCSTMDSFIITQALELKIQNISKVDVTDSTPKGEIKIIISGGTPPYDYNWSGPNGFNASTQDITGLVPGCYKVEIKDDFGCSVYSDDICIEDKSTATFDLEKQLNIQIFPNPANDILYIKYDSDSVNSKDIHINMYSITGSKVKSDLQLENMVDIKNLDEGIYLIKINTNDNSLLKKIVVIR